MQNRINRIKEYFVAFNIAENIAYVKVNFPKKWDLTSGEILNDEFKCNAVEDKEHGGIYFFSDMENGITNLFDAIDFTIDFNKDMELKSQLFLEKMEEMKTLFSTLPLDELKTMEFAFKEKSKTPKADKNKEVKNKRTKKGKNGATKKDANVETSVVEENEGLNNTEIGEPDVAQNSLLSFAEELITKKA